MSRHFSTIQFNTVDCTTVFNNTVVVLSASLVALHVLFFNCMSLHPSSWCQYLLSLHTLLRLVLLTSSGTRAGLIILHRQLIVQLQQTLHFWLIFGICLNTLFLLPVWPSKVVEVPRQRLSSCDDLQQWCPPVPQAVSQCRLCVLRLPKGPLKDLAFKGHTHILLPSSQWDGVETLPYFLVASPSCS